MSRIIGIRARTLPCVTLAMCLGLMGNTATAQSIQGTATYRERMALPLAAVLEVALEDASRADAPAETIALRASRHRAIRQSRSPSRMIRRKILPDHRYVVRARILLDDKLLFITDTAPRVITRGSPTSVTMMLRRVGAGQAAPPNPAGSRPLEGTYWKAIEVAGKPTPTQDANREAYLLFQPGGRLSGSDGCNRIVSSYELKGDVITFGQVAGTQMPCLNTGEIERAFWDGLKSAARSTIVGDRLELFDPAGRRVAAFTAGAQRCRRPHHDWKVRHGSSSSSKAVTIRR